MRMTAKRYAEISASIHRKLVARFPIGCRVRLSPAGRAHLGSKYAKVTGRVVAYSAGVSPKVLWAGRKTADGYASEFLSRIRRTRR